MSNNENERQIVGCGDSICAGSLAHAVDTFVLLTTFVPIQVSPKDKVQGKVCTNWSGKISAGHTDVTRTIVEELTIPSGYVFFAAKLETKSITGSPEIELESTPPEGATGRIKVQIYVHLKAAKMPETIDFRVCVITVKEDAVVFTPERGDVKRHRVLEINYKRTPRFLSVLEQHVEREFYEKMEPPRKSALLDSVDIQKKSDLAGAEILANIAKSCVSRELDRIYEDVIRLQRGEIKATLQDNGKTLISVPDHAEALRRLGTQFRERHKFLLPNYYKREFKQRESTLPLITLHDLGFLFLDRVRIRPIGHTPERAPFYELSLEPGEQVTLRQKSFSKRAVSFESTVEESEERTIEYSSTFTTDMSESYSNSVTESSNWGANASATGTYGVPQTGSVSGTLGGSYGASSSSTDTSEEQTSKAREITRRVETTQKTLHKTVVTIATENILEEESIKVIRNDDNQLMKIFMRRLMQVLHLSYERYGIRLCWAPCIQEPGRDVRSLIPGENSFPEEIQEIKDRWANKPAPEELGMPPSSQDVTGHWTGLLSGGLTGESYDTWHSVTIPDSYEFADARLDKKSIDGSPNVYIKEKPSVGSKGVVRVKVHVGLSGGFDAENINYRVVVSARPDSSLQQQWQATVDAWRRQEADKEIEDFLNAKRDELKGVDPSVWPNSELMRRIIAQYFGNPQSYGSCEVVSLLQQAFEWENLSFELRAPWWSPNTEIDGLQSLQTNFTNASWAKVYVPIRPDFEEEALSWLLSIGAIPYSIEWLDDFEYYLHDMRANLQPAFERNYEPTAGDAIEIDNPCDIELTQHGQVEWKHKFEQEPGFLVLDRWIADIPTDGVDYEEQVASCDVRSEIRQSDGRIASAEAKLKETIASRVEAKDEDVKVSVEWPGSQS